MGGGPLPVSSTQPGLIHDECSAAHPLALDTPFSQRFDLEAHGLTWRWPEIEYAHPLDGGVRRRRLPLRRADGGRPRRGRRRLGETVRLPRRALRRHHRPSHVPRTLRVPDHLVPMALLRPLLGAARGVAESGVLPTPEAPSLGPASRRTRSGRFGPDVVRYRRRARIGRARLRLAVAEGGSAAISGAMISRLEEYGAKFETGCTPTRSTSSTAPMSSRSTSRRRPQHASPAIACHAGSRGR